MMGTRFSLPRTISLTYIIIGVNVLVYVCTSFAGQDFLYTSGDLISRYGQYNRYVYGGSYWQLLSSMFVHANIVHLVGNMFFFLIFGLRAEELFSRREYLAIYFGCGLAGNLLTLLMGPDVLSVGASGAIFGVFGACIVYIRRTVGQSIIGALVYAFFLLVMSSGPGVNNFAHLGGLAVGLLIGYRLGTTRGSGPHYVFNYAYSNQVQSVRGS